MTFAPEHEDEGPKGYDPDEIVQVGIHLFDVMCIDREIADGDRHRVHPSYFVDWLEDHIEHLSIEQRQEIVDACEPRGGSADGLEFLLRCTDMPMPIAVSHLEDIWTHICMSHRAEPVENLLSFQCLVLLRWRNGSITPLTSFVPKGAVNGGAGFVDKDVLAAIDQGGSMMAEIIADTGLANFEDNPNHGLSASPEALNSILRVLGYFCNGGEVTDPETGKAYKCSEEERPHIVNLAGLLRQVYAPKLSKKQEAAVEENRRARASAEATESVPLDGPRGGWDGDD